MKPSAKIIEVAQTAIKEVRAKSTSAVFRNLPLLLFTKLKTSVAKEMAIKMR
jgi:hypothetical protein